MNKPEPFFWGGVSLMIIGFSATGVSAYYKITSPKNDKNSTLKTVSLAVSIVLALVGVALFVYYYRGYSMDGGGECPLEQIAENIRTQYPTGDVVNVPPAAPAPPPVPAPAPSPVNFNISVNPAPQKTV